MKKLKKTLMIICLGLGLMTLNKTISAQPMMGADISYSCVGQDSFLVTLTYYRDCNAINPGTARITARCVASGSLIAHIDISRPTAIDITPVCAGGCTRCQSSGCSFLYGIEKFAYSGIIYLGSAGSCCEISFSYTNCCRKPSITTGAADANLYLETRLNRCLAPCDNSPVFVNEPISIFCKDQDYVYSFYAVDTDKDSNGNLLDSLSYEIVPPLRSATSTITYSGQYSYDKPFEFWGFPNKTLAFPRGFHFDNKTGTLMFRPNKVEQTVMAVKVTSWRKINGVRTKISEITRDLQYIVINCVPINKSPSITGIIPDRLFNNISFSISTNDEDLNDSLSIEIITNCPGLTYTYQNIHSKRPGVNFNYERIKEFKGNTAYHLTIKVNDNACPLSGHYSRTFLLLPTAFPDSVYITDSVTACNIYHFSVIDSPAANYDYYWTFGVKNPVVKSGRNVSFYAREPGLYPLRLSIGTGLDALILFTDTIRHDTLLSLEKLKDMSICPGDTLVINPVLSYEQGKTEFRWSSGDSSPTLKISPDTNTFIYLTVSDNAGCEVYDTLKISVNSYALYIDIGEDLYPCYNEMISLKTRVPSDTITKYTFNYFALPDNRLIAQSKENIKVTESGTYYVRIHDPVYCSNTDTIKVQFSPEIKAYAPDQTVCPYENVTFTADSTGSKTSATIYEWYDQSGSTLLVSGQIISIVADVNKEIKLLVKEWHQNKHCKDEKMIRLNRKKVLSKPGFPGSFCINDSFINMNLFIDTSKASIYSSHPSFYNEHFYNPSLSGLSADTVTIRLNDYLSGCIYDSFFVFLKKTIPNIQISNQHRKDHFCPEYGLIQLYASPAGGKYGGKWYGQVEQGNFFNADRSPGTYTLVYEFKDNNECVNRDTMVLNIGNTLIAIDKADAFICSGKHFSSKAEFTFAERMQWVYAQNSDGFIIGSVFNPNTVYVPGGGDKNNRGFVLYARTVDPVCPEIWDSVEVYIAALPKADFSTSVITGTPPLQVQFSDQSSIPYDQISEYKWYLGDGSQSALKDPLHDYSDTGWYDVSLKVITAYGCEDSIGKKKLIYVYPVSVGEYAESQIKVYPNPANDKIIIESSENLDKVILYNFLGAKIRETEVNNESKINLERGKLPSGLYLLKVYDKKGDVYVFQVVFK